MRPTNDDYALRDRVLLYLTGMGLDDVLGLEIAAECLRRAGAGAGPETAMAALRALLGERGLTPRCFVPGEGARSFPPLRRKTMVSGWTGRPTLYMSAKRLALRVIGADGGRDGAARRSSRRDRRERA